MNSKNYKMWEAETDLRTCKPCIEMNGKIYLLDEPADPSPPMHPNCRCGIEPMKSIFAGFATQNGLGGADWWLKRLGRLPGYYVTWSDAKKQGWQPKNGNLYEVLPGKMIARGIYRNKNGHLPAAPGRIWYEADINYTGGYRNLCRILFSNDGLIFVTYNHYYSFYEVI